MTRETKDFDAVESMRTARAAISAAIEGMSLEQELEWLASRELGNPLLERLRARAAEGSAAAK